MSKNRSVFRFYLQTILISWLPWLIAIFIFAGIKQLPGKIMLAVGGIGPAVSAIILVTRSANKAQKKDYWRRLINFRLITGRGLLFLFLFPVISPVVSILISLSLGGSLSQFRLDEQISSNFLSIIPFAIFILFLGPVPEELGWRGYWLDKLRSKYSGLTASLIIAVGWSIWHLPLFFMPGYPLQEFTASAARLAVYFLLLLPLSIIYTYVFYRNNRSTISAILFHFMVNFTGSIIAIELQTEWIQLIVYFVAALILIKRNPQIFAGTDDSKTSSGVTK